MEYSADIEHQHQPSLIWIFAGQLEAALDSATWLQTTRELRILGWEMTLVALGNPKSQTIAGTQVECISSPDIYILRQIIFHLKLIGLILSRWSKTDLILFSQPSAPWLVPLRFLRFFTGKKKPLLVMDTRTVPMEDIHKATLKDNLRGLVYTRVNKTANRLVDGQTAITYRMAVKVGIPPDKLWGVWPSGADIELFSPASRFRVWPEVGAPIVLIYIGVLHYERNLMNLCKAVEQANQTKMKFRLILTGNGTEKEDLIKYSRHTEGRIQVNDAIPHHDIPALLAKAHIGVLPFPDEEKYRVSSPIKLFEYMASGLAIMATRVVCHTDVIRNGGYCFWSEDSSVDGMFHTLEDIWLNQSQLSSMGNEAMEASLNWTWKESAKKLSQALLFGILDDFPSNKTSLASSNVFRRR